MRPPPAHSPDRLPAAGTPYLLGAGDGQHLWFLGNQVTWKATGEQTHGRAHHRRIHPPRRIRPAPAPPPARGRDLLHPVRHSRVLLQRRAATRSGRQLRPPSGRRTPHLPRRQPRTAARPADHHPVRIRALRRSRRQARRTTTPARPRTTRPARARPHRNPARHPDPRPATTPLTQRRHFGSIRRKLAPPWDHRPYRQAATLRPNTDLGRSTAPRPTLNGSLRSVDVAKSPRKDTQFGSNSPQGDPQGNAQRRSASTGIRHEPYPPYQHTHRVVAAQNSR